jgi:hypothetical protein
MDMVGLGKVVGPSRLHRKRANYQRRAYRSSSRRRYPTSVALRMQILRGAVNAD